MLGDQHRAARHADPVVPPRIPAEPPGAGVAAVRFGRDGLAGVGNAGGFPVGRGGRGAPGVVLAQQRRGVRGQDAEPPGQPRLGTGGQLFAERASPVVQPGGQLVRYRGRVTSASSVALAYGCAARYAATAACSRSSAARD